MERHTGIIHELSDSIIPAWIVPLKWWRNRSEKMTRTDNGIK